MNNKRRETLKKKTKNKKKDKSQHETKGGHGPVQFGFSLELEPKLERAHNLIWFGFYRKCLEE